VIAGAEGMSSSKKRSAKDVGMDEAKALIASGKQGKDVSIASDREGEDEKKREKEKKREEKNKRAKIEKSKMGKGLSFSLED
jgi:hypothetical protein